VEINLKDLKDTMVLMLEHPVGDKSAGRENIDDEYITGIMSSDWGFYYTFTTNLKKVIEFIPQFPAINGSDSEIITGRINGLIKKIEDAPKGMKWKLRAKIGTRARWYQEVSEKGDIF